LIKDKNKLIKELQDKTVVEKIKQLKVYNSNQESHLEDARKYENLKAELYVKCGLSKYQENPLNKTCELLNLKDERFDNVIKVVNKFLKEKDRPNLD
jgi:hypothetical protein